MQRSTVELLKRKKTTNDDISHDLDLGEGIYNLIRDLFPICRSITGDGVRESMEIIKKHIPVERHEISTGTRVFDWTIPKEWNIKDAWIRNQEGEKIVDFNQSNLHVLNYSIPVDKKITFEELKPHLYTDPEQPNLIPYRTSYYNRQWGFCLSHDQLLKMQKDEMYHVFIDSTLTKGSMTYGELYIEGQTTEEVLISTHICHPSLCNDNLSGVSVAVHLAKFLLNRESQYSYRFIFIPGTIGAIAWLALNEKKIANIKHGLVLACVGDEGNVTYKKSRQGKAEIDQIVEQVLGNSAEEYEVRDFSPYGFDERQFCSPAFNLPVGCFMRTPYCEFPEYHTSADNLDFVQPEVLADSLYKLKQIVEIIEGNGTYLNLKPQCEPHLGKYGLYKLIGGYTKSPGYQRAILWILNYSDGNYSLLDIAKKSGLDFNEIKQAAAALERARLLKRLR